MSSSNIWDNLKDKPYQIKIGNSIKNKNVSYHSIHYNIKPPSIDHNKKGALHCSQDDELFLIEYASQQSEEIHQFNGNQKESNKELILFYDEATNTFTLEKLDSTFHVRRVAFNKSRSKLAEISTKEVETISIPTQSNGKSAKRATRATKAKNKVKESSPENPNPVADTYEEESVEEFDLELDNNDNDNGNNAIENDDNRDPFAVFERMKAESAKAKAASAKSKTEKKQQKQPPPQETSNDDVDNMVKEFEEGLEEFDVAAEAEKEIEEFALEDELEQELEKELEVSGDEEEHKLGETRFIENDNDNDSLEEEIMNDTLELDSSEEDSDDNISPGSKRKMDQDMGDSKRAKPNEHEGPISLSAYYGNYEEDEESTESSSSDD